MAQSLRTTELPESSLLTRKPMPRVSRRSLSRSAIASYWCICTALLLLLGQTLWGSYRDVQFHRMTLLDAEIDTLRSHAERTVGRIEHELEMGAATDLTQLDQDGWLKRHWDRAVPQNKPWMYAAVVDPEGMIMSHSDSSRTGKWLPQAWYGRALPALGGDVVEATSPSLVLGQRAYDVRVPIEVDGREIGSYHAGLDVDWFERTLAEAQSSFLKRRLILVGGVLLVVLLAATALYYIVSHSLTLRRAIASASIERSTEVGKLAAGLAHEIRNPLHAIQLNLHMFRRIHKGQAELAADETTTMLEQSIQEIGRIEQLMQQLVGFAVPEEPRDELIDLSAVIRDVVDFIQQELLEREIAIQLHLPDGPVRMSMDEGRLRQIMLNLLQNAQQAMQAGGRIDIRLERRRGRVAISVADDGSGIAEEDRPRIFDPFFSTKPDGTGLGLALVKRFVEELHGEIRCESNAPRGTTFRIVFHESRRSSENN